MLPDKSQARRSPRLHRPRESCECASPFYSPVHIRSTPCWARKFPGDFFRFDSFGFSLTRREVSTNRSIEPTGAQPSRLQCSLAKLMQARTPALQSIDHSLLRVVLTSYMLLAFVVA